VLAGFHVDLMDARELAGLLSVLEASFSSLEDER
jgi:hypothetical protein